MPGGADGTCRVQRPGRKRVGKGAGETEGRSEGLREAQGRARG